MNLSDWIRKILIDDMVTQVRLDLLQGAIGDPGETVQVWDRDQLDPIESWLEEAEQITIALGEDLPVRRHRLAYVASDLAGHTRAQLFRHVNGKNKDAKANGDAAAAAAMHSLSKTMQEVSGLCNAQLAAATSLVKAQAQAIESQTALIIELRAEAAVGRTSEPSEADKMIAGVLQEVPEFLKAWAQDEFAPKGKN